MREIKRGMEEGKVGSEKGGESVEQREQWINREGKERIK